MIDYQHLIGRTFLWGVRDCLALLRDVYHDCFGVELTDFARPVGWQSDKNDLIRKLYEIDGFKMMPDWKPGELRPGDVLAMAVGENAPNHLGIFVGDGTILNHFYGGISRADPFRDFFRSSTCFVLRHPLVTNQVPELPTADVRSLLRARYQPPAE